MCQRLLSRGVTYLLLKASCRINRFVVNGGGGGITVRSIKRRKTQNRLQVGDRPAHAERPLLAYALTEVERPHILAEANEPLLAGQPLARIAPAQAPKTHATTIGRYCTVTIAAR